MGSAIIAGAGPGGAVLGFLLARRGVDVTLLERQTDFAREFRGEVLLPNGLEPLREMGLWESYEEVPQVELRAAELFVRGRRRARISFDPATMGDIAPRWVSQPHFLEWLVSEAAKHPSFRLDRGVTVRDLLRDDGRIVGLRCVGHEGERDYTADVVVGADGRSSVVRRRANLAVHEDPTPMDIVWFKLPRPGFFEEDLHARIYVGDGHLLILAPVPGDLMQVAWIIPKGGFGRVRERGMDACIEEMARHVSEDLAVHLRETGASAMESFLLSTVSDRVEDWTRPGMLVIGDAAHTMSPVGGQGLNHAIRDAVVAANRLVPVLAGEASVDAARIDAATQAVPRERRGEIARIQRLQAIPPRILFSQRDAASVLMTMGAFFLNRGWTPPVVGSIAREFFFGTTPVRLEV